MRLILLLLAGLALFSGCDLYDAVEGQVATPLSTLSAEVDTVFTTGACGSIPVAVAAGIARQTDDRNAVRQTRLDVRRLTFSADPSRPIAPGDTLDVDITAYVILSGEPVSGEGVPVVATRPLLPEEVAAGRYMARYVRRGVVILQPLQVGCDS